MIFLSVEKIKTLPRDDFLSHFSHLSYSLSPTIHAGNNFLNSTCFVKNAQFYNERYESSTSRSAILQNF